MATKVNKSKLKKNITNINTNLKGLANELEKLSKNLDTMMKGNADGPYWNGQAAKTFYTKSLNNLKNDVADYKAAYKKLNSIAVKYENLAKKDK